MKKVFLFFMFTVFTLSFSFSASKKVPEFEPIELEKFEQQYEDWTFRIDPRIDVVAILLRLNGNIFTDGYNGSNEYLEQLDSLFKKYKDHKAVKTAKKFVDKGFPPDAFISLAYHIKPDFSGPIVSFTPTPETLYDSWKKVSTTDIYNFIKDIHDFVKDTNYSRLLILHKADMIADMGYLIRNLEEKKVAQWFNDFFGDCGIAKPQVAVTRVIVPWTFYDIAIDNYYKKQTYLTICPYLDYSSYIRTYIYCFANKYAYENWATVKTNYQAYMKTFTKKHNENFDEKKYKPADTESLVNLISLYCLIECSKTMEGQEAYEEVLNIFKLQNMDDLIDLAINVLNEYVENRDKYPNFISFAPRMNEFINSLPAE